MQKTTLNKRIYLSGGGNEHQSFPLDKFFFDALKEGGRFLYIPVALRGHRLYPTANLWMDGILKQHNRTDIEFEVADDLSDYSFEDLKSFDAVYIGGGNTWSLMGEVIDSKFSDALVSYLDAGGQLYGGSAGAIILGQRIDTHDDENKIGMTNTAGLGQLGAFSVTCHFKDEDAATHRDWAIENGAPLACLPEETGLIVEDGTILVVGEKDCTVYLANGERMDFAPGQEFEI